MREVYDDSEYYARARMSGKPTVGKYGIVAHAIIKSLLRANVVEV